MRSGAWRYRHTAPHVRSRATSRFARGRWRADPDSPLMASIPCTLAGNSRPFAQYIAALPAVICPICPKLACRSGTHATCAARHFRLVPLLPAGEGPHIRRSLRLCSNKKPRRYATFCVGTRLKTPRYHPACHCLVQAGDLSSFRFGVRIHPAYLPDGFLSLITRERVHPSRSILGFHSAPGR